MEKNTITIRVPEGAGQVLKTLHGAGFEAYVVGGCVRDSILMHTPQDWDITTSAKPNEVKALFRRTVDTGIRHGTVTVLIGNEGFEVTTYRIDGAYEDGRHPKSVTFTASLDEDLKRRDFTVNAMAYSEETGLIDLFGGLEDLKARVIRAVGDPTERFTEDALRMMRAVRFAAQLDAVIEKKTLQGIRALAPNLRKVSAERTRVELEKLLVSDHPEEMRVLYETGLTAQFLPEFDACMTCEQHNPHHCYTVGEHIIHALCAVRSDKVLRLTMLLHDIGKPQCRTTDENGIDHFHGHVALGAKMADPAKQVVAVCGDGAFQMSMFELATIAVNQVAVKILVLRNEYLGLVREHQEKVYEGHYSGVMLYAYPHFDKLAEAYDMAYFHADSNEALDQELDRFLACEKAAIMVCDIDSANNTK